MLHSSSTVAGAVLLQNFMAVFHLYNIYPEKYALVFLYLYVRFVLASL